MAVHYWTDNLHATWAKCYLCKQPIRDGESWRYAHENPASEVCAHEKCELKLLGPATVDQMVADAAKSGC